MISIKVNYSIEAECCADRALGYLWDINNMPQYEPKVDSVRVTPESNGSGTYSVRGYFAGISWAGKFDLRLNTRGFESEAIKLPLPIQVRGGFVVTPKTTKRCQISHTEEYRLPWWTLPLCPALKIYLRRAIKREMENLQQVLHLGDPNPLSVQT
jgi:uncharacterized membrane protein